MSIIRIYKNRKDDLKHPWSLHIERPDGTKEMVDCVGVVVNVPCSTEANDIGIIPRFTLRCEGYLRWECVATGNLAVIDRKRLH